MAKRRKAAALPRVTLIAYSRKDLVAFTRAVEALSVLVGDLRGIAGDLLAARKGRKAAPKAAAPGPGE